MPVTLTRYTGSLRPIISYLGKGMYPVTNIDRALLESQGVFLTEEKEVLKDKFKIQWIEDDDVSKVVWTEEILCLPGFSFIPQISGDGQFKPTGAMYIDKENKRHRVLNAQTGIFGAVFDQAQASKK